MIGRRRSVPKSAASSADALAKRRSTLARLMATQDAQGRTGTWHCSRMREAGYPNYTPSLLAKDKQALRNKSNFTIDLLEKNYSAVMGSLDKRLEALERAAVELSEAAYPQQTTVRRTVRDKDGNIVQTVDEVRDGPPDIKTKLQAIALVLSIVKQRYDLYSGQNIHVAATMLKKKFDVMEQEIGTLRGKLQPNVLKAVDSQITAFRKEKGL